MEFMHQDADEYPDKIDDNKDGPVIVAEFKGAALIKVDAQKGAGNQQEFKKEKVKGKVADRAFLFFEQAGEGKAAREHHQFQKEEEAHRTENDETGEIKPLQRVKKDGQKADLQQDGTDIGL